MPLFSSFRSNIDRPNQDFTYRPGVPNLDTRGQYVNDPQDPPKSPGPSKDTIPESNWAEATLQQAQDDVRVALGRKLNFQDPFLTA